MLNCQNEYGMRHLTDAFGHSWSGKREFRLKRFISLEEIDLSRKKQNFGFYLFDKSWNFSVKHLIYRIYDLHNKPTFDKIMYILFNICELYVIGD